LRITIGRKITYGFSSILVLILVVAGIGTVEMTMMGRQIQSVDANSLPSVQTLSKINQDVLNVQRLSLEMVLEKNQSKMVDLQSEINTVITDLATQENRYQLHMVSTKQEKNLFNEFLNSESNSLLQLTNIETAAFTHHASQAYALITQTNPIFTQARTLLGQDMALNTVKAATTAASAVQMYRTGRLILIALSVLAIALGGLVGWLIHRMISRPLISITDLATRISAGDLTAVNLTVKNHDEIGDLAVAFKGMLQNLRRMIQQVGLTADLVAASSEQLSASAEETSHATQHIAETMQDVASGSDEQASSVEKGTNVMNEMAQGIEQISLSAQTVSSSAEKASVVAVEGFSALQSVMKRMDGIQTTVTDLSLAVARLGERSAEIGNIVEVITNIASQTNLLALNAAIESARAGEHGRGFAVVADEVRKLAVQSANSASQIASLIHSIQGETKDAIKVAEAVNLEVSTGLQAIQISGQSFDRIQQSVNHVSNQIKEVSTAVQELSVRGAGVASFMEGIAQVATNTAAGVQSVSASAEEQLASMEEISASALSLSTMAEELQLLVGQFQL